MLVGLVFTLVAGGVATYWQSLLKIETELGSALANAKKAMREALPEIESSDNPSRDLVRLVRTLDGNRHVRARLTLSTGVEATRPSAVIESKLADAPAVPKWFVNVFPQVTDTYVVELGSRLQDVAAMELTGDMSSELVEIWDDARLKLAILMVFCLVLCALVYFTLERALDPMKDVLTAFEQIGAGDYSTQVVVRGPEELSRLCEGVNDLAERLSEMELRNQRLNEQLATVQDEERADLARDLHDEISPFLFSVEVDASAIHKQGQEIDAPDIRTRADAIREATAHMMKHVRSLLDRLRPATQLELGLEHAVDVLVSSWRVRQPNVVFSAHVEETGFDHKVDAVIHGIVREGLSNALKHGKPSAVNVAVSCGAGDENVVIRVQDNGRGVGDRSTRAGSGFGLISIRERVGALGGTMSLENCSGGPGAVLVARLPKASGGEVRRDSSLVAGSRA